MRNTDSMKMLPVIRLGISVPSAVTMGICALRSTWRRITVDSRTPLARAVRT